MFGLDKYGGIGLHRIARFARDKAIDLEELSRRSIVITGTNGKGSTTQMTAEILTAHGLRTGRFTSPHMFNVRERFQIDGERISAADFDRLQKQVADFNDAADENDKLGSFQFIFLIALMWFAETRPDIVVWEAGVGGRYDPVRSLRAPVGGLTSVELEHTNVLGSTVELIAYDKADAIRPGGRLIVSPAVDPNLHERLRTYCSLSDKSFHLAADTFLVSEVQNRETGASFTAQFEAELPRHARLGMAGRHQTSNASVAVALAQTWMETAGRHFEIDTALNALAKVHAAGRLERISHRPEVWIDVGHTPQGVSEATTAYLDFRSPEQTLIVFGVSSAKEVDAISRVVASRFRNFILTSPSKGGAPVPSFRSIFDVTNSVVAVAETVSIAADMARQQAIREGFTIFAVGGLFLAAEFQHTWFGGDPTDLEFL